jgi:hypothetical protein
VRHNVPYFPYVKCADRLGCPLLVPWSPPGHHPTPFGRVFRVF